MICIGVLVGAAAVLALEGRRIGRPALPLGIRSLVRRISRENPLWAAPHIHGELLKLSIEVANRRGQEHCPPKAEVVSSNLAGSAIIINGLARYEPRATQLGEALGKHRERFRELRSHDKRQRTLSKSSPRRHHRLVPVPQHIGWLVSGAAMARCALRPVRPAPSTSFHRALEARSGVDVARPVVTWPGRIFTHRPRHHRLT